MITFILFFIIAIMRVIQAVCNKRVSNELKNTKTFFLYGVYYQALAAVFSLLALCLSGFKGLTLPTILCAFVTAAFLMINIYANLNAIKGCKLIVCSMFSYGGLIVCCVLSWIMFGEEMSVLQGVGLALFFLSAYMISSQGKEKVENTARPIAKKVTFLLILVMLSEGLVEVSQKYFSKRILDGEVAWFSFFMFLFGAVIMATGYAIGVVKDRARIGTKEALQPSPQSQDCSIEKEENVTGGKRRLNKILLVSGALLAFAVFVINTLVTEMGKRIASVRATEICDEFRYIYDTVKSKTPKNFVRVAVLNAWGKKRSWMCNMTAHELWYQQSYSYQGIYEALSGLPVEVSFIDFNDVKAGRLSEFDVVINAGDAGTAWSGGEHWADEKILTAVRKFVYNGGGFIGVGEPTALQRNGKFFQLSDVLGVDKECGISLGEDKYNIEKHGEHFILDGIDAPVDYGEDKKNIYALAGTNVVDIVFSDRFVRNVNVGEVKMATNTYGKGRSFYITGLPYSAQNAKLLYRAILWTAGKEASDKKSYCENPLTEAHFYGEKYAVINNTDRPQKTVFYDITGKAATLELKPWAIVWIDA